MIKMGGMLGFGTRINQEIKKGKNSPFSVQANFVCANSYLQSITSGSSLKANVGHMNQLGSGAVDRSPNPFGGKFLKIFVVNHQASGGEVGYVVPTIGGVEQDSMKCEFTTTTEVDEEFKSPDGAELSFEATDEIGWLIKSTSGQLDYTDYSLMIVIGFDTE